MNPCEPLQKKFQHQRQSKHMNNNKTRNNIPKCRLVGVRGGEGRVGERQGEGGREGEGGFSPLRSQLSRWPSRWSRVRRLPMMAEAG